MNLNFVDHKTDVSYETLLAKIAFKFCNNYDGRIYAFVECDNGSDKDVVVKLVEQLTPFIITKKMLLS